MATLLGMHETLREDSDKAKPSRYPRLVTNRPQNTAVRRTARVLAILPAVLVSLAASAAIAEPPEGWENTPSVSGMEVIVVLLLIPLGLFLLICLLVYLPSMIRGNKDRSSELQHGKAEWFGGPDGGLETVDTAGTETRPVGGASEQGGGRSGASGSW